MGNAPEDPSAPPPPRPHGDITVLLSGACNGEAPARDRLLSEVYDELRIIAARYMRSERTDHTLGATALVNESYLKLFRDGDGQGIDLSFDHRHAFFKAAAVAMRRILIDHARAKATEKRRMPGPRSPISVDLAQASATADPHDLLALDEALDRLEAEDPRAASVVRLRFFAGRPLDEIAEMLEVSDRTIKRDWEFARARLQQLINTDADPRDGRP
ncbi:MAG: ECF-type sigma factor [Phycisphaerales bacterium]